MAMADNQCGVAELSLPRCQPGRLPAHNVQFLKRGRDPTPD